MPINQCRVCHHRFFEKPLLRYEQMPQAAQYLPDAASLTSERGVTLEVYQCTGCGLVQLNSDPVPYYREVIRASAFSPEMREFRLRQFAHFVERFSLRGKKVLEIGCGHGEYLSLMAQAETAAYGLEQSAEAVAHCRQQGLRVFQGFIEGAEVELPHAPYAGFFILNFLEHLPDPGAILRGIYHHLSDEGRGLVEVPNFEMMLQKKLFTEFIADHLCYFTKETLIRTLGLNGFEVLECQELWHQYILSAVVQKRKALDLSSFASGQRQLQTEVAAYLVRFAPGRVAVWGAGHQALAALSLLDIGPRVKYVVDSAPFKQGKYTPATHLPIVSPEMLQQGGVEAIIVMAASYSDEVAQIIKERYPTINVAILREVGLELV
jgi:2-polyprenyl-3-methyl-5-hydroxy-6-metoxy-1,4-benzoquinol methylase